MRHGMGWLAGALLATGLAGAIAAGPAIAAPAKAKSAGTRQFTGYVTALDQSSITVEKRGKQPKTVVFAKHAEMKSTGAVEKEARVTVFYRDVEGKPTATRVVAKPLAARKSGGAAKREAGGR
jgi:hypothetical protein